MQVDGTAFLVGAYGAEAGVQQVRNTTVPDHDDAVKIFRSEKDTTLQKPGSIGFIPDVKRVSSVHMAFQEIEEVRVLKRFYTYSVMILDHAGSQLDDREKKCSF